MDTAAVSTVVEKAGTHLRDGNYYEASQLYRSAFTRWAKKDVDKALELAVSGAEQLCQARQYSSATALADMILEVYSTKNYACDETNLGRLKRVLKGFPIGDESCCQLYRNAIAWTVKALNSKDGEPSLRLAFGVYLWKGDAHQEAQIQFLFGSVECARALANLLVDWVRQHGGEADLQFVLTRAVLHYLTVRKVKEARELYQSFTARLFEEHPRLQIDALPLESADATKREFRVSALPLVNFALLIILTVERTSRELFVELSSRYQHHLQVDPALPEMMQQIERAYFPPANAPQAAGANPFAGLLQSLLGGGGASSSNSRPPAPQQQPQRQAPTPSGRAPSSTADDLLD